MKLELLPNEILLECFKYLDHVDIFYSFDQLNYRFNKLIRNIPLHLDFRNINILICDQFCKKILSNQEMKKQIISLILSNKDTCYKIQSFLSIISLDEFPHLRSLTLVDVKRNNILQLTSMLPLISQLSCFRLIDSVHRINELFSVLPISHLRTLMIPTLPQDLKFTCEFSSIINLTIVDCYLNELFQILKTASKLKYFNVQQLSEKGRRLMNKDLHSTNLKQLIIMDFAVKFDNLRIILKQTPNLQSLTINVYNNINLIDAIQWEQLISSSLSYLDIFKFKFGCSYYKNSIEIHEKFKSFQSDFWCKKHHWYTEYSLSKNSVLIYTLPYLSNTYQLTSYTTRYCNALMKNDNTFDNIVELSIHPDAIREQCQYYFPYVISIELEDTWQFDNYYFLENQHIKSLKMIVNLSNAKHLKISSDCKRETSSILLEILKEAPQISSITIGPDVFKSLCVNNELYEYLNRMIKKIRYIEYFDKFI
ncbi:unnamed protein product [Rotaria sordida]|uniref:F-box domain-containing protein n=1 Tax=Rotaria sordida TaxID=392033 RepID=A0A815MWP5_9BILA|nr:unnamed protein product [Rotaria sordida]